MIWMGHGPGHWYFSTSYVATCIGSGAEGFTVEMWCDSVLACLWKRMLGGCPWSCCDVASGWLDVLYVYRFYVVRACGVLFGDVLCFADRSLRCFWRFVARLFLDVLRLITVLLFCSVVIISSALQVVIRSCFLSRCLPCPPKLTSL